MEVSTLTHSLIPVTHTLSKGISNRTAVAERILPVLSVFAEWAWEHPRYLILQSERSLGNQNVPSTTEINGSETSLLLGQQATVVTTFSHLAPSDVLLGENDARLQMKTAVCALQELVEASIRCIPGASGMTYSHTSSHPLIPTLLSHHASSREYPPVTIFHLSMSCPNTELI